MKANTKLTIAKDLFEQNLSNEIKTISINVDDKQLHIIFHDGIHVYIVYNDYEEYSYSIIFSKLELDRCRFDNYDNRWEVSTRPHHFHPRKTKEAIESPMKGSPRQDIKNLIELLKTGKLKEIPS